MFCSMTQSSASDEVRTRIPSISIQALYHWVNHVKCVQMRQLSYLLTADSVICSGHVIEGWAKFHALVAHQGGMFSHESVLLVCTDSHIVDIILTRLFRCYPVTLADHH